MAPTKLSLAVCLFPIVCPTDFQGPIELLSSLAPQTAVTEHNLFSTAPAVTVEVTYLAVTSDPVQGSSGPKLLPDRTYESIKEGEQFDIILVPGGLGTRPGVLPQPVVDFVKRQAPGAKYVLSVCTGSEVLAVAGILNGRRATTNKSLYTRIVEDYKDKGIMWVPKARWVVDGNVWTASGVTAGADMGYAFLRHLVGDEFAEVVRGIVEIGVRGQDDDEFAAIHKLV